MQVVHDENGLILSFAFVGDLVGGVEVPDPAEDIFDHFMRNFYCYQVVDGQLQYNVEEFEKRDKAEELAELRKKREEECFSYINRGQLWYENLSIAQLLELRSWYKAWLEVTETKVIPDRPEWLDTE